jgi:hypothetical protein
VGYDKLLFRERYIETLHSMLYGETMRSHGLFIIRLHDTVCLCIFLMIINRNYPM